LKDYTTVIGLEVHVQLNTISKAFCADPNIFGQEPNTNISAVSLALPGTLPVLNKGQVASSVKLAHALGSAINKENRFDRKNYFYPDLPKGYQITQDKLPVCVGGEMTYVSEGHEKKVRIHHVHMEEDAGKSSHDLHDQYSMVDINRAGTPLVEIVTEPDLRSAQEVHDFIAALQQLVRYLGISDGNMEEGSLRCDVNVSVMPSDTDVYGERNEIKNVNSKKFAKTAVEYESKRQIKILEAGGTISMNTLLFDPTKGTTAPMRSKEEANDYRYFPDPDLPPVVLPDSFIDECIASVTLLPWTANTLLKEKYGLSDYDADLISREKPTVEFIQQFELPTKSYSTLASFIANQIFPYINEMQMTLSDLNVMNITNFITLIDSGKVSRSGAIKSLSSTVLKEINADLDIEKLAHEHNLIQSDDQDFLDAIITEVLAQNEGKVKAYQSGKKGLLGFFMGQVMGRSKGKADPKVLNEKLGKALE